jgi:hypothetical protein
MAKKMAPIRPSPCAVEWALLAVAFAEDEEEVAEDVELPVEETGAAVVADDDEPVLELEPVEVEVEVPVLVVEEPVLVVVPVVVAVVEAPVDDAVLDAAAVDCPPLPVEVRIAVRRFPMLLLATHLPATFWLVSYAPTSPAWQQNPFPSYPTQRFHEESAH